MKQILKLVNGNLLSIHRADKLIFYDQVRCLHYFHSLSPKSRDLFYAYYFYICHFVHAWLYGGKHSVNLYDLTKCKFSRNTLLSNGYRTVCEVIKNAQNICPHTIMHAHFVTDRTSIWSWSEAFSFLKSFGKFGQHKWFHQIHGFIENYLQDRTVQQKHVSFCFGYCG